MQTVNSSRPRAAGPQLSRQSALAEVIALATPLPTRMSVLASGVLSLGRVWVKALLRTSVRSSRPRGAPGQPSPANHSRATIQTPARAMLLVVAAPAHSSKKLSPLNLDSADSIRAPLEFPTIAGECLQQVSGMSFLSTAQHILSTTAALPRRPL